MSKHGKHKMIEVKCENPRCRYIFMRQRRRVKVNGNYCQTCRHRQIHRIRFWPTNKLKEVIKNDGQTDTGRDYEQFLSEIKEVLWDREYKLHELETERMIKEDVPF